MIEKMIESFNENFNEEIYGKSLGVLTPIIIKTIFEYSDIFKLLNVNYKKEAEYESTPVLINCGSFGFNNDRGFNKHNFHTERYMGLTSEIEYSNIVAWEIVSRFEFYLLKKIIESADGSFIADFKENLTDISREMYRYSINYTIITSKNLLNETDLELLNTKYSIGHIVHLRDNIYVYKNVDDENNKFNNIYIVTVENKLCDYVPAKDVLVYRMLKDESKFEIYFNASFEKFNRNIKIIAWR